MTNCLHSKLTAEFWYEPETGNAFITVDLKRLYLGCFETAELAHAAYRDAASIHHGEYGRAA